MNYPRNCSASGMFVFNNIPSFMELWRNYIVYLCYRKEYKNGHTNMLFYEQHVDVVKLKTAIIMLKAFHN